MNLTEKEMDYVSAAKDLLLIATQRKCTCTNLCSDCNYTTKRLCKIADELDNIYYEQTHEF